MYCPQCGNVVAEGAKFCNQCGKPLAHPQAPAPTPTSSVAMSDVTPNQATPATTPAIPQPIMGMPPLPQPHHPTPVATQPLHSPTPAMPASSQPTVELPTPGIANPTQQFNASGSSTPTMPQPLSAQPAVPQAPPQYIQQPAQPIDMGKPRAQRRSRTRYRCRRRIRDLSHHCNPRARSIFVSA